MYLYLFWFPWHIRHLKLTLNNIQHDLKWCSMYFLVVLSCRATQALITIIAPLSHLHPLTFHSSAVSIDKRLHCSHFKRSIQFPMYTTWSLEIFAFVYYRIHKSRMFASENTVFTKSLIRFHLYVYLNLFGVWCAQHIHVLHMYKIYFYSVVCRNNMFSFAAIYWNVLQQSALPN